MGRAAEKIRKVSSPLRGFVVLSFGASVARPGYRDWLICAVLRNQRQFFFFRRTPMQYPDSFEIAERTIAPPLVLSPMAGVTDSPFRRIAKRCGGIGLIVTEFISV
jgi:hypothetical protein